MAEPRFTVEEKRKCAEREVGYRKRVFARRVGDGKMTPAQAEHEIGCMEAIAQDYREQEASLRLL